MNTDNQITFLEMINNNPSLLIAVIAFVSPIITTLINNIHNAKIRGMELKAETDRQVLYKEIQIFEDALAALGRYASNYTVRSDSFSDSLGLLLKAYPYICDKDAAESITEICSGKIFERAMLSIKINQISSAIKTELNKRSTEGKR